MKSFFPRGWYRYKLRMPLVAACWICGLVTAAGTAVPADSEAAPPRFITPNEFEGTGDWRNIGILLACVDGFSIENLAIRDSHAWAISLERCGHGRLRDLDFASSGFKTIDGVRQTILNQDGIDLRMGCHEILIDGLVDTSPESVRCRAAVKIGDHAYGGGIAPLGDTYGIVINNVLSKSRHTILIGGSLSDSILHNILRSGPGGDVLTTASGPGHLRNVTVSHTHVIQGAGPAAKDN